MINVFLDDERQCPKGFVVARSVDAAKDLLINNEVNILSLDHDLGDGVPTGYDLAKFVVEMYVAEGKLLAKEIYLHTANPVGRENMFQLLNRYLPIRVHRHPYRPS